MLSISSVPLRAAAASITALVATAALGFAGPGARAATTINVTSVEDVADATPSDGTCDTPVGSLAAGKCTLRAALATAPNLTGTTTIVLPAGMITLKLGELSLASNMVIVGQGAGVSVIDADNKSRALDADCVGSRQGSVVILRAVSVRNGNANVGEQLIGGIGGGIITCGTDLTITDSEFSSNTAGFGGGVAVEGKLTVSGSRVVGNHSTGSAIGTGGGGIILGGPGTITNSAIANNTSDSNAGGIEEFGCRQISAAARSSRFQGRATTVLSLSPAVVDLAMSNVTISGNTAALSGGGVQVAAGCGFSAVNATIAANTSSLDGSEILGLSASSQSPGQAQLTNTIVAGGNHANCAPTTAVNSKGHNLSSDSSCSLAAAGDQTSVDPKLKPLALNAPGTSETMAIGADSPANDHGLNSACPTTDQRGVTRVTGTDATCDVGAYEFHAVPSPSPSATPTPTPTPAQGAAPAAIKLPKAGGPPGGSPLGLLALVALLGISVTAAVRAARGAAARG